MEGFTERTDKIEYILISIMVIESLIIFGHLCHIFLEQQKRRRFHPLRNLRRIFRRRTITSVTNETPTINTTATLPPTSSTSEKNLRTAALSPTTVTVAAATASSPSSPLTHQQLQEAYSSQSLPKSKSYTSVTSGFSFGFGKATRDALMGGKNKTNQQNKLKQQRDNEQLTIITTGPAIKTTDDTTDAEMYSGMTTSATTTSYHRQSMGVAVLPTASMGRSFFTERQKIRSIDSSSQELNDSSTSAGITASVNSRVRPSGGSGGSAGSNTSGVEINGSQRSLSEGRLMDSDYSQDQLSQSHDSVFSESATASSLSIVLKAELADVLRKRRNRPDASDEDLGLPRSPASPHRRNNISSASQHITANGSTNISQHSTGNGTAGSNYSEVSSLSLGSVNSTEGDEFLASSTANNSSNGIMETSTSYTKYSRSSTLSVSSDILRHSTIDEVDLLSNSNDFQRLSHSAAKHKMAIRPAKKKGGPSRHHRRTLEVGFQTSIPEANEENPKVLATGLLDKPDSDMKIKTRSLPPGVNAKQMEQHTELKKKSTANTTLPKTTTITSANKNSTTTTNTTAAANNILSIKRNKVEINKPVIATSNLKTTNTTNNATNLFGFRALSNKASAIFETKETHSSITTIKSNESLKKETNASTSNTSVGGNLETTESGFLRRLIQRNSKRSISKVQADDEADLNQNEPKKLQISNSCYDTKATNLANTPSQLVKSRSAINYKENIEETRKDIKREILSEGTVGLSAMLNVLAANEEEELKETQQLKPKTGPAARQRCLPQELASENTLERKATTIKSTAVETNKLNQAQQVEVFQSTSIIREITATQASTSKFSYSASGSNASLNSSITSREHLFEKKPRIIGLSAFQQKISRSNDSFGRNSASSNSLESTGEPIFTSYDQKQRKAVEKSRSFRTYNETRDNDELSSNNNSPTVHNNMPSLPDLSLNLRVPYYSEFILNEKEHSSPSPPPSAQDKCVSLGFEINDNNLMKSTRSTEFTNKANISAAKSVGAGINKTTSTKLLSTPTVLPSLSPSNSCNKNISEIEQNIDLIVKSPFISVLRKSATVSEELTLKPKLESVAAKDETFKIVEPLKVNSEKVRPTVLNLTEEPKRITQLNGLLTPKTAAVPLRHKPQKSTSLRTSLAEDEIEIKEVERKSAPLLSTVVTPISTPTKSSNANISTTGTSSRRGSSSIENTTPEDSGNLATTKIPEFMKIQLNRVDPARLQKANIVYSKNIKETGHHSAHNSTASSPTKSERSASNDDLSMRRVSSTSIDIMEHATSVSSPTKLCCEAINKQAKSTTHMRRSCELLPPKSPAKKIIVTPAITPTETTRETTSETKITTKNDNAITLQERRRLFMSEEHNKGAVKIEAMRNDRKKSINEEVYRKPFTKIDEKADADISETSAIQDNTKTVEIAPEPVVLRKKSFGISNNIINNNIAKDDTTPELMKVFARRSLKIKDEDLAVLLNEKVTSPINSSNLVNSVATKKFATQNIDSDKENQSSSEEKLDQLTHQEHNVNIADQTQINGKINNTSTTNNRSTLADYRNNYQLTNGNNNANNNSASSTQTIVSTKSQLPARTAPTGYRNTIINNSANVVGVVVGNNNNNNNMALNNNNSTSINNGNNTANGLTKIVIERKSMNLKATTSMRETEKLTNRPLSTNDAGQMNKTIERSATVSEFKGIHQRRAEWEQRAKEALK